MPPALMDLPLPEPSSVPSPSPEFVSQGSAPENRRFGDLRGLLWRINLGVLPSSSSASIDDLRRATADSRRRYASLRRRLLVDPHIPKDGSNSPDLTMDNPLSQNPDSTWGRFFRNAELERMVDQDLSRLYPEHGSYFQTAGCQGLLRRILLLWCLRHPECGYRQGMHELLAPLLYVLQVDLERLSEIRKLYEDHFTDRFDGILCQENDLSYNFDFSKSPDLMKDDIDSHGNAMKMKSLDELDPEIQTIVLLSDAYGAEGELGIVLSEKFLEHDAYCIFDALMNGAHGSVVMADFFLSSPAAGSHTGLPPVIEDSTALYQLLSLADSSLHSHLVDLGIEPQYFSLRWLRVLFGREFSLSRLLIIWDEIFASDNRKVAKKADDEIDSGFRILHSPRGTFIIAMAVAMLLQLRSSLLATENPTTCLQRLLNFPEDANIKKLLEKAKSLQALALSTDFSSSSLIFVGVYNPSKSVMTKSVNLPSESVSPKTPLNLVTDSYWEEKWRVLHNDEELKKKDGAEKHIRTRKKEWMEKVKFRLKRAESDPSPSEGHNGKKEYKASVRRSLLEDLSRQLGSEEDTGTMHCHEILSQQDNLSVEGKVEGQVGGCKDNNYTAEDRSLGGNTGSEDTGTMHCHEILSQQDNLAVVGKVEGQDGGFKDDNYTAEDRSLCGNTGSEENLSASSDPNSPPNEAIDHENDLEKSSVASNLSLNECNEIALGTANDSPLPISDPPGNMTPTSECNNDTTENSAVGSKERRVLLSKFPWLWKFGRNAGEGIPEKRGGASEAIKSANSSSNQSNTAASSTADGHCSSVSCKGDSVDQNVMGTLRNIGQSMLEHIQVIESVFQPERGQGASLENFSKNVLAGKGQVTAMTALKELRKISNLLFEM